MYDEKVGGKPCLEKYVSENRVTVVEDSSTILTSNGGEHWSNGDDDSNHIIEKQSSKSSSERNASDDHPDIARTTLVGKLLRATESDSESVDINALSTLDVLSLHDSLTPKSGLSILCYCICSLLLLTAFLFLTKFRLQWSY